MSTVASIPETALNIYHKRVEVIPVVTMWAPLYLAWHFHMVYFQQMNFSGGSAVKNPPASAGDAGSIPGPGRSPGKGNGNPLQYSCLGNPMDRGAWQAIVHGIAKSET